MRLTKKKLKDAKEGFNRRMKELGKMNSEQLRIELKRMFPHMEYTGTDIEIMDMLARDLLDRTILDHWIN